MCIESIVLLISQRSWVWYAKASSDIDGPDALANTPTPPTRAIKMGVPKEHIIIENQSQNTGQNYEFTTALLQERGVSIREHKTIIAVQKQFMERRTYATGKVWWPDVDLLVTSPPMTMADYPASNPTIAAAGDHWVCAMVGDLQRIREYPTKGFQIAQEIPVDVWQAFEALVRAGYTKCLIK